MADNENMNLESIEPVETVHGLDVSKSLLAVTLQAAEQEPKAALPTAKLSAQGADVATQIEDLGRDTDEEYETIPVRELDRVKLGRQGENDTQTVVIDCSEWMDKLPGCTLMIAATRPGEREVYLPEVRVSNGVVTWPIMEQDTALAGAGRAEVRAMKDGKVKKSALFKTFIEPALEADGSPDAPVPPNWVKDIMGSVETSQAAAEHAEALIEEATACAINAVRFDEAQNLTDAQKSTGRANIGAVAADQGAANVGKALVVNANGTVTVGDAGIPDAVKAALLRCFEKVAWADEHGQDYYDALEAALRGGAAVTYATVLYSDGTFIINERSTAREANLAAHGTIVQAYDPLDDEHDYSYTVTSGVSAAPWASRKDSILRVEVGSRISPVNMRGWFLNMGNCVSIDLANLNGARNVDLVYTFQGCSSLTSLDLSQMDTSMVRIWTAAFKDCSNLETLNLAGCSSASAISFNSMFNGCKKLKALNLGGFNTSGVGDMNYMFSNCAKLVTIYVSAGFVVGESVTGTSMFSECASLVGGNGTRFSSSHIDKTYARIDAAGSPGYFTLAV